MGHHKRIPNRLKEYDYSQNGVYFITVCVHNRKPILSRIIVEEGLAPPAIKLLPFGEIALAQLMNLQNRFPDTSIDRFVIMPNHIHLLLRINNTGRASPSPTVPDMMRVFKSLTTRECKKLLPVDKLFQRSYYDHIVRDEYDYEIKWKYIDENPAKWCDDELYTSCI